MAHFDAIVAHVSKMYGTDDVGISRGGTGVTGKRLYYIDVPTTVYISAEANAEVILFARDATLPTENVMCVGLKKKKGPSSGEKSIDALRLALDKHKERREEQREEQREERRKEQSHQV